MLLHAFYVPPGINTFLYYDIKQYYAYSSIVFINTSLEYYVKISGSRIYDHLNPNTNPNHLNTEMKDDWLFLLKRWDKETQQGENKKFNKVLKRLPEHARKRLNNTNAILERDIKIYESYIKKYFKHSLLRHSIVHPGLNLDKDVTKDIYSCMEKDGKLLTDLRKQPEIALDFNILCIKVMEYFTYVCFPGIEGNSRSKIKECFDVKDMILHSSIFEYDIPQQLIDLLDQKLANYP
ncbi:MAG: hypothetical protein KA140_04195 [Caldisericia bacterium]|nr:hypothetical protein [Caldisericia bacterium]